MDGERNTARGSGRELFLSCFGVALLAVVALALASRHFDPSRLHVSGLGQVLNDQAGYVTTARTWLDTGELRSGLTLPAFVENPRSRIYMPGHYAALAVSYQLLGYSAKSWWSSWSALPSLLPSLASFVLGAVATYAIGRKKYGRSAGLTASILFVTFPATLAFAFTAMAELTFLAAGLVAFAVLLHLPRRARPWCAPFLIGLPFLFRETGALWVLPMAVAAGEGDRWSWRTAYTVLLASAILLIGLNRWQIEQGKEPATLSWITHGEFNYVDATPREVPNLSAAGWAKRVAKHARSNLYRLAARTRRNPLGLESATLIVLTSVFAACLCIGLFRVRDDPLLLASGCMGAVALAMAIALYDSINFRAMRATLFAFPLCALGLVGWLHARRADPDRTGRVRWKPFLALLLPLVLIAELSSARTGASFVRGDASADANTRLLETLGHDDRLMLVSPLAISLGYAVEHYPAPWSFVPANRQTFRKLADRFRLGTVVLPERMLRRNIPEAALVRAGLAARGRVRDLAGREYLIYQRPSD